MSESYWRKHYQALRSALGPWKPSGNSEERPATPKDYLLSIQENRYLAREERKATARVVTEDAKINHLFNLFEETINRYPATPPKKAEPADSRARQSIVALLGDIHYGLSYANSVGVYNSSIAKKRMDRYLARLLEARDNADSIVVVLLGDLISGRIHKSLQIENRENVVEQIIGISEVISEFLWQLAAAYSEVKIVSVSGNHSRLDDNALAAPRGEKLDVLIPWYCKTKLAFIENVEFIQNIDDSIAVFECRGKTFAAVHGDYDDNQSFSAQHISRLIKQPIDVMLSGHMHVPEMRFEDIIYIRNGSLCGSGDEYTVKKRLFSPPYQVYFAVTDNGVHSFTPVMLN